MLTMDQLLALALNQYRNFRLYPIFLKHFPTAREAWKESWRDARVSRRRLAAAVL